MWFLHVSEQKTSDLPKYLPEAFGFACAHYICIGKTYNEFSNYPFGKHLWDRHLFTQTINARVEEMHYN